MPQQRQGAGPVIRQPDRQVRPLDVGPAQVVVCGTLPLDERAVIPGQFPDFIFRDGMESPFRFGWAMPQRDREQPARLEQGHEFPERSCTVGRCDVHPDGAEENDVERETGLERPFETRQGVGDPLDRPVFVPLPCGRPHVV